MEEDRAANQRSALSLSFTLALYISNGFVLSKVFAKVRYQFLLLLSSSFSSEVLKSGINSGSCNHEKSYKINLSYQESSYTIFMVSFWIDFVSIICKYCIHIWAYIIAIIFALTNLENDYPTGSFKPCGKFGNMTLSLNGFPPR